MSTLRTIIADDEPLARDRLRAMLRRDPSIEIVAECGSGPDTITAVRREKPDVVFLDVQMPGCDGLQVVSGLDRGDQPAVVFVTAHETFAVEAFAVEAVDFLLKPFDLDRLEHAVRRVREHVRHKHDDRADRSAASREPGMPQPSPAVETPRPTDRITVRVDGRVVFLEPTEIVWVEAADNYVVVHLRSGERLIVRETLSSFEERLCAAGFTRVNRSAVVNVRQVRELQPTLHGDYAVVLRNGTKIPLSRNLRSRIDHFMSSGR
ncbi:LytR/AlgR family response regulator transcription factor [Congregicoccus parvus]|uniref:LytR/AlgR family response regulator transcription factor n=1 Tax=Congregicoccus parvus TaxID=3081749 RepID=UPI003FA5F145